MRHSVAVLGLVACLLSPSSLSSGGPAHATDDRASRILAHLRKRLPDLQDFQFIMASLQSSPYGGLDEGAVMVQGPGGATLVRRFFVTPDDKALYLWALPEPMDVSLAPEN